MKSFLYYISSLFKELPNNYYYSKYLRNGNDKEKEKYVLNNHLCCKIWDFLNYDIKKLSIYEEQKIKCIRDMETHFNFDEILLTYNIVEILQQNIKLYEEEHKNKDTVIKSGYERYSCTIIRLRNQVCNNYIRGLKETFREVFGEYRPKEVF